MAAESEFELPIPFAYYWSDSDRCEELSGFQFSNPGLSGGMSNTVPLYTADQMRQCATAARAPLLERIAELERRLSMWEQLRDAVAEIEGYEDGWPSHGNAPLAIAASCALRKRERDTLRAELERCRAYMDAMQDIERMARVVVEHDYTDAETLAQIDIGGLRDAIGMLDVARAAQAEDGAPRAEGGEQ